MRHASTWWENSRQLEELSVTFGFFSMSAYLAVPREITIPDCFVVSPCLEVGRVYWTHYNIMPPCFTNTCIVLQPYDTTIERTRNFEVSFYCTCTCGHPQFGATSCCMIENSRCNAYSVCYLEHAAAGGVSLLWWSFSLSRHGSRVTCRLVDRWSFIWCDRRGDGSWPSGLSICRKLVLFTTFGGLPLVFIGVPRFVLSQVGNFDPFCISPAFWVPVCAMKFAYIWSFLW